MLEHQHWGLQMPNVRRIWHFKPQSTQHLELQNPSIANFFAILLQCNNAILKVELHYSSIVNIYIYIYIFFFLSCFSLEFLSPFSHYLCSLLSFPSLFLIYSLLSSNPNTILLPTSTSHVIVEETLMLWLTRLGSTIFFFPVVMLWFSPIEVDLGWSTMEEKLI